MKNQSILKKQYKSKDILLLCLGLLFLGFGGTGFLLCGCSSTATESEQVEEKSAVSGKIQKLKIVAWNAETFFDGQTDGIEYSDFKKSSAGWGRDAYIQRLDRLCEVIKAVDADVVALEEIENEGILYDISNRMAGNSWLKDKVYDYACFAKNPGDAIGCAILSKNFIGGIKTHNLSIQSENQTQPSMRPILEVQILVDGKPLTIFVNHWKSMSGGEEESDIWREWQESVLAQLISDKGENSAIIACGDFNRNIEKFEILAKNSENSKTDSNVALNFVKPQDQFTTSSKVSVYSPWILDNGEILANGSYYYNEEWNYIDHFFSSGSAKIVSFNTETNGAWADENGIPQGYKIFTGGGYSDHLPISCVVEF